MGACPSDVRLQRAAHLDTFRHVGLTRVARFDFIYHSGILPWRETSDGPLAPYAFAFSLTPSPAIGKDLGERSRSCISLLDISDEDSGEFLAGGTLSRKFSVSLFPFYLLVKNQRSQIQELGSSGSNETSHDRRRRADRSGKGFEIWARLEMMQKADEGLSSFILLHVIFVLRLLCMRASEVMCTSACLSLSEIAHDSSVSSLHLRRPPALSSPAG